jgi:hypothetical protein
MSEFRQELEGLRMALREEGERSVCPGLAAILERERSVRRSRLGWAAVAAAVTLLVVAIPFYQEQQKKRDAEREQADRVLFEQVNEGLSRSVSPAMAPLLGMGQGN